MDNKTKFRNLCGSELSIPIFSRAWWLDAVCGSDNWDVAVVENAGNVVAAMPYYAERRLGLTVVTQPPLTQVLGPWLRRSSAKYAKALGQQKDLMYALIDQLPPFDHFVQNWHYNVTNWQPFYWRGFEQTTRYTYVLPDLSDDDKLWAGFQESAKTDIRKAVNRVGLKVREDSSVDNLLPLCRMTFGRQGRALPFSESFIRGLDDACRSQQCRKIWIVEDDEGRSHAGAYVVWDENSAYYLIGGADPTLRNSGAAALCLWHAVRHAAGVTKRFDFEGSMLEPVERFFRAFGAVQIPYFRVSKTPSRILRVRSCIARLLW